MYFFVPHFQEPCIPQSEAKTLHGSYLITQKIEALLLEFANSFNFHWTLF